MSYLAETVIIVTTWFSPLLLLSIGRSFIKQRFLAGALNVRIPNASIQDVKPGSSWSKIGALFVFAANIATFALRFVAAVTPPAVQLLDWIRVVLPPWINVLGSILCVLKAVWGLRAALFNPNYTLFFQPMKKQFLLDKSGPYAEVRHPRYAGEAWLNVILFMFTGIWLPLLGVLGWIAMYDQARAEEEILITLAGEESKKYHQRTGMFSPSLKGIH